MAAQGYIGRAPGESSVIVARQTFTPTGITTNFTFASGYTVGYVDAYLNGVRLIEGSDYTATDGSVVGLTTHAQNGDVLELVVYKAFNVGDVTGALNDFSVSNNLNVSGVATVTGAITATGGVVGNVTGDATGLSGTPDLTIRNLTGVAATFTGVLSYDDVTNVDAVGYSTFREGINVQGAGSTTTTLNVTGVTTMTGDVNLGAEFNIPDAITHVGDTNTKIRFPANDTFTVETAGGEALRVDSSKRLVVGADASVQVAGSHAFVQHHGNKTTTNLAVAGYANNLGGPILALGASRSTTVGTPGTIVASGDILGDIRFAGDDGTDINSIGAAIRGEVDGAPGSNDMPGRLVFLTTADGAASATERLRIDSSGRLLVATTSARTDFNNGSQTAQIQLEGTSADTSNLALVRNSANTGTASLIFGKSRASGDGGVTVVNSGDTLGSIDFEGADGTDLVRAALIRCEVDGTPGSNDMPGRLVFSTTADGASSVTERLRIDSTGNMGLGTSPTDHNSFTRIFDINGSGGGAVYCRTNGSSSNVAIFGQSGSDVYVINKTNGNIRFNVQDSERMRIDNGGRLLLGTNTSRSVGSERNLQIEGTNGANSSISVVRNSNTTGGPSINIGKSRGTSVNADTVVQNNDTLGTINFRGADGVDLNGVSAAISAAVEGTCGSDDTPGRLIFSTTADGSNQATERLRIDSSGRVLIGTTSARTVGGVGCHLQVEGTGATDSSISLVRNTNGATHPPYLMFGKSRSGSLGGNTIVQDDDLLGYISFNGSDGNDLDGGAAAIQALIDGTPGSNDMPGRLEFMTTSDGSNSPTTRVTINRSGDLTATGNVTAYSDISLKENIETIPNALDKVLSLRGVEFDRTDTPKKEHQIGVIAQEVERVIPEVVLEDKGIKSVAYGNLVGLLIESIKELKTEVNDLKAQLEG